MERPDTPDCSETLRELDRFLDSELSADARSSIRRHLESCPDCLGAFDFHAELKVVIATKCQEDEMPADLLVRIERCFSAEFDTEPD